jgi:hypothetical protein
MDYYDYNPDYVDDQNDQDGRLDSDQYCDSLDDKYGDYDD